MDLTFNLDRHLREKLDNRLWVKRCLSGNVESFPYRADAKGRATIGRHFYIQIPKMTTLLDPCENHLSQYVVNIPMSQLPGDALVESFTRLLYLFLNEAFGISPSTSSKEIKQRVVIVIGINQIRSIDPSLNQAFAEFIGSLPRIEGFVYSHFGFFWNPQWIKRRKAIGRIYSLSKAFLLLKALSTPDANIALRVREAFEGSCLCMHPNIVSQVPYQNIRNTIHHFPATRLSVKRFEETSLDSAIYFVVMDADLLGLRKGEGLFTRIDTGHKKSIISFAYHS